MYEERGPRDWGGNELERHLGDRRALYICRRTTSLIGMRNQDNGLGWDRAMTSAVRTGSVRAQIRGSWTAERRTAEHIDMRKKVELRLILFLVGASIIPKIDGVQRPGVPPTAEVSSQCVKDDNRDETWEVDVVRALSRNSG
ncbi:hypothetical protein CC78DRAFT_578548 [Lojkania enalia]|uniref:Uncharacterized protein n=1 Tax=Lojkania enalia TaxID=147567 RepID=A0A9P4N7E0_9PLEO|nr:hypothetical protein CC78DRAFT_578548 [Didymosphaeria enalia]